MRNYIAPPTADNPTNITTLRVKVLAAGVTGVFAIFFANPMVRISFERNFSLKLKTLNKLIDNIFRM